MTKTTKSPKHLTIVNISTYEGMRVNSNYEMIEDYLKITKQVIDKATEQFPRTSVFLFGLNFPKSWGDEDEVFLDTVRKSISKFWKNLDREISKNITNRMQTVTRVHPNEMRYIWAKERKESTNPHYHAAIFLNADCFKGLGAPDSKKNSIAVCVIKAWLKALNLDEQKPNGLVHFPSNPIYLINKNSESFCKELSDVFYRLSYLSKFETKEINSSSRSFGYSLN